MKAIQVKTIRQIVNGKLVRGDENWHAKHIKTYSPDESIENFSLVFVRKNDAMNWQQPDTNEKVAIITDQSPHLFEKNRTVTIIQVPSLIQAYWSFIQYYRGLFKIPIIAITGTCGKTTTKEMLKHILSKEMNVHTSLSSKNEPRQSLPYLLGMNQSTEAAVFELGLGNSGNIKHQCLIYEPTIGVITNIGVHHLDGCKNLDGYIQAKAEIIDGIRPGGTLILNADDENSAKLQVDAFQGKIVTFGRSENATIRASAVQFAATGMKFQLHLQNETYPAFVPGLGEHQVDNALAAIAVLNEMGLSIRKALLHLRTFQQMERHLQISKGLGGCTVIDDTWTNNPTSVAAALKVVHEIGKGKKTIVIIGDIKRLGQFEKKYHRELGTLIAQYSIDQLITVGTKAAFIADQARRDKFPGTIHSYQDISGVMELLRPIVDTNTIVLIKGPMSSRAMIAFAKEMKEDN